MFFVRNYTSRSHVVFYEGMICKLRVIGFDGGFGFQIGQVVNANWLKASNGSHIEESGSDHAIGQVKSVGGLVPEEKGDHQGLEIVRVKGVLT